MILFRTFRRRGIARVRLDKPLSDREVAANLVPMHSGHVEVAPLAPPVDDAFADLPDAVAWPDEAER